MVPPEVRIQQLFRRREVVDMAALEAEVGRRSRRSVFRDLKRLGYLTSFTHRGAFYTLEGIPRFDASGLWFHDDVGFSRFGTLKRTVAELVPQAPEGQTHGELSALLRVRVHNTLLDLVRAQVLARREVEEVGEWLYLSSDPSRAAEQMEQRLEGLRRDAERALPPPEVVIAVLVEALRAGRVRVAAEQVARRLNAQRVRVGAAEVERILEHHGLGGKKNSPHPRTSSP